MFIIIITLNNSIYITMFTRNNQTSIIVITILRTIFIIVWINRLSEFYNEPLFQQKYT